LFAPAFRHQTSKLAAGCGANHSQSADFVPTDSYAVKGGLKTAGVKGVVPA
jgi:hypothetical protein